MPGGILTWLKLVDFEGMPTSMTLADKLQGFAIAGEDQRFVWADAMIDGDSVVVSSVSVPKPTAVRYAWSQQIPWANLFNKDGLPAPAFRTDYMGSATGVRAHHLLNDAVNLGEDAEISGAVCGQIAEHATAWKKSQ